jgi:hypothetical protein
MKLLAVPSGGRFTFHNAKKVQNIAGAIAKLQRTVTIF